MEELILNAQNGSEEAFTKLILFISDDLYKVARTRISNEADIADAVQETMIETYKSINELKDINKFKKWTIKILINKCNRIYRRKYKKDLSIEEIDYRNDIENRNQDFDSNINFFDMIKILSYEERIIVVLYYMEDYSVKDIKNILKMKENTINTHLFRARKKIKNIYYNGGEIDG